VSTTPHAFAVGQVWKYVTLEDDEESTLTIVGIENMPWQGEARVVVHISITGLTPRSGAEIPQGMIRHVPLALEALERSVTELVGTTGELPPFQEGYAEWERAKGGWFTVSVAEVVELVRQATNPQH
jgi:hypothetical protein